MLGGGEATFRGIRVGGGGMGNVGMWEYWANGMVVANGREMARRMGMEMSEMMAGERRERGRAGGFRVGGVV